MLASQAHVSTHALHKCRVSRSWRHLRTQKHSLSVERLEDTAAATRIIKMESARSTGHLSAVAPLHKGNQQGLWAIPLQHLITDIVSKEHGSSLCSASSSSSAAPERWNTSHRHPRRRCRSRQKLGPIRIQGRRGGSASARGSVSEGEGASHHPRMHRKRQSGGPGLHSPALAPRGQGGTRGLCDIRVRGAQPTCVRRGGAEAFHNCHAPVHEVAELVQHPCRSRGRYRDHVRRLVLALWGVVRRRRHGTRGDGREDDIDVLPNGAEAREGSLGGGRELRVVGGTLE